jgi:hypothetical protein
LCWGKEDEETIPMGGGNGVVNVLYLQYTWLQDIEEFLKVT